MSGNSNVPLSARKSIGFQQLHIFSKPSQLLICNKDTYNKWHFKKMTFSQEEKNTNKLKGKHRNSHFILMCIFTYTHTILIAQ